MENERVAVIETKLTMLEKQLSKIEVDLIEERKEINTKLDKISKNTVDHFFLKNWKIIVATFIVFSGISNPNSIELFKVLIK